MKNKRSLIFILFCVVLFVGGCQNNGRAGIIPGGDITLSVYGLNGEVIIDSAGVKYQENLSAADLSREICRELKIPIIFSGIGELSYVKGINNLFEFDHGALSGWIYFVNGESQGASCYAYILKDGDHVDWKYTLYLGKDIGASIFGE